MVQARPGHITSEKAVLANINIISKAPEHLYLAKLVPYLAPYTFGQLYSMEKALLKIANDMFKLANLGHTTIRLTPDLSTAFDTIDHWSIIITNQTDDV